MRLTDPKWPAVREFSRRILTEEGIQLISPPNFEEDHVNLLRMMSDKLPARLDFPELMFHDVDVMVVRQIYNNKWEEIMRVGLEEPPADVLWIPLEASKAWETVWLTLKELLEAGYPGCLGCGGPASEEPWDEAKNRLRYSS